jgi:ABC-type multidrug transport system ATPase subunit
MNATPRSNRPQSTRKRARDSRTTSAGPTPTTSTGSPSPTSATSAASARSATSTTSAAPSTSSPRRARPPAAIETAGLAKHYGDNTALAPLDLRIEMGDRISLIGHNGSGKTTLLRMLVGMLEPSEGSATIHGHPAGSLEAKAAVSYLADQPVFYDDLTVWEHLEYIARLHGTDEWEQQAVDLAEMVGLTPRLDDLPVTFSRGLKQKAAITMAFVRPFDVMLIDEPFVGLDRTGREALLELLALAHDDGATMIVATHELSSVASSSRLIALSGGELTYDGSPGNADLAELTEGAPVHPE